MVWLSVWLRRVLHGSVPLGMFRKDLNSEGVENEEDLDLVKAQGCDIVQGYYFAKPMPPEDFIPWARDYSGLNRTLKPGN